jgi:hypothetical protein
LNAPEKKKILTAEEISIIKPCKNCGIDLSFCAFFNKQNCYCAHCVITKLSASTSALAPKISILKADCYISDLDKLFTV